MFYVTYIIYWAHDKTLREIHVKVLNYCTLEITRRALHAMLVFVPVSVGTNPFGIGQHRKHAKSVSIHVLKPSPYFSYT